MTSRTTVYECFLQINTSTIECCAKGQHDSQPELRRCVPVTPNLRRGTATGFPLHSGFVDVDHLVQMVKATGIHEARHPEVQFALAVQVFAYPHNVLSVWVYVASITPR